MIEILRTTLGYAWHLSAQNESLSVSVVENLRYHWETEWERLGWNVVVSGKNGAKQTLDLPAEVELHDVEQQIQKLFAAPELASVA